MISLLAKLLIPNRENYEDPEVRGAYGFLCGAVGIFLNVLLFAAKYLAGALTGSIAVTADAFNNLSDAGSSVITLLGFKLAAKKPNRDHPYGHGRFEYISGLIVSMAILLMGFELGKSAVEKLFHPEPVQFSMISVAILAGSMLVKLYMAAYNRGIGRRIHSVALTATGSDSLSDVCATGVVLAVTLIEYFFGVQIDAYAGIGVSLLILWVGLKSAKETTDPLLGKAPEPEFVKKIEDIVGEYPEIVGMHDLMVHDYGAGRVMISLHAEVPDSGDIMELHDVIDTVERRLADELNCLATIHMDPISTDGGEIDRIRALVLHRIQESVDGRILIHDFRMVPGPTHTNVIFDAVVPFDIGKSDATVRDEIEALVRRIDGNYFAVVTIDHPLAGEI